MIECEAILPGRERVAGNVALGMSRNLFNNLEKEALIEVDDSNCAPTAKYE